MKLFLHENYANLITKCLVWHIVSTVNNLNESVLSIQRTKFYSFGIGDDGS